MRKRAFAAAPASLRCAAVVTLRDGSTADCMRWAVPDYGRNLAVNARVCEQHATMILDGKRVTLSTGVRNS